MEKQSLLTEKLCVLLQIRQSLLSSTYVVGAGGRTRVVLRECDVDGKSNEIIKIPELLRMLEIKAAIVGTDAMG